MIDVQRLVKNHIEPHSPVNFVDLGLIRVRDRFRDKSLVEANVR